LARKKKSQPVPPWVWLFTGVVTGLFLAFLYHLASIKTTTPQPRAVEAKPAPRSSKPSTKYDFYTLLPDKEVVDATTPRPKTTPKPDGKPDTFLIQTGSFRSAQDADRRRAELILLGLDVKVQAVELGGEIWHRVQIGPLDSDAKLDAAKTTLSENKVEYLVTRLK
jgi:cell division protein FtsN